MRSILTFTAIGCFVATAAFAELSKDEVTRLREGAAILTELRGSPDKGIPEDLWKRAECVLVIPSVKKAAFIVGGQFGRGFASCRKNAGHFGAPAAIKMEGGSFGLQLGGQSTDVIMLVMNRRGMEKLATDKFTIGGDASAAAGPVGRTGAADTDILLHAEILSYSRTRGVFAGVSLDGTVVSHDGSEDRKLYGHEVSNQAVLTGEVPAPVAARALIAELDRYSPAKH